MKVAVLIDDFFFASRISEVAKHTGADVVICRSAEAIPPDAGRICVDLNAAAFDALAAIRVIKSVHSAPVVAYVSHVQTALKKEAEEAGADEVLPRSVFVQRLPQILS